MAWPDDDGCLVSLGTDRGDVGSAKGNSPQSSSSSAQISVEAVVKINAAITIIKKVRLNMGLGIASAFALIIVEYMVISFCWDLWVHRQTVYPERWGFTYKVDQF